MDLAGQSCTSSVLLQDSAFVMERRRQTQNGGAGVCPLIENNIFFTNNGATLCGLSGVRPP